MGASLKGSVVVINFPFSDLSNAKRRPALIVADWNSNDVILCQITSVVNKDQYAVELNNADFISGSLMRSSYIRLNKLFTADKSTLLQNIGYVQAYKEVIDSIYLIMQQ